MYGQMTAGSWIYIGTQGILQGTYETFAAVAAKKFGGTLAGTITLTAGLGGMGGAQPLAVTMNDGVAICIDCRPARHRAPHRAPLPRRAGRQPRARPPARRRGPRRRAGRSPSACSATPRSCCRGCSPRARPIDIVTDQTSAHDPLAYLPDRRRLRRHGRVRRREARRLHPARPRVDGPARRGDGRLHGRRRRGLRLRQLHPRRGPTRRIRPGLRLPRLRARLHPAAVLRGQGPLPLGGAVRRRPGHRRPPTRRSSTSSRENESLARWIKLAGERVHFQGLPARICWLGYGERDKAGERFNDMVADGELARAAGHRPRPPRLRLGGLALPRDRGHARRLRRHRRLAAAQRHGQRRLRRLLGLASTTAAASAWAARSTPAR